jgi:hypothetical protein
MDEVTYRILTDMQLPQVHLISLSDFERDDSQLLQAKQNRSLIEYYFTCTPSLPLYVLDLDPEVDIITYLDADLYFFSSIEPVYQELGNGSVLIIGHRFSTALSGSLNGTYNVGLLSFRRDSNGLACLQSWRDNCIEWCYDRVENGRYADQKYLDVWPDTFSGIVVLQHKGAGLAPWNLANYVYSRSNGKILVDGQSLIVYHFEGVKRINRWVYDINVFKNFRTILPWIVREMIYTPYLNELSDIKNKLEIDYKNDFDKVQSIRVPAKIRTSQNSLIYHLKMIGRLPFWFIRKLGKINDLILIIPRVI